MKYNIFINQKVVSEMGLKLDLVDLALFDFFKSYIHSTNCTRLIVDGREYGWIDANLIIREMPILGISTPRGINLRIDNLINAGLIERAETNQSSKKSFFCMGPRYDEYEGYAEGTQDLVLTSPEPAAPKETKKPVQLNIAQHLQDSPEFMNWWGLLMKESKWKQKSQRALQMSMDKLNVVSVQDAVNAIKETIERGYQGIFPRPSAPRYQPARQETKKTSLEELLGGN